MCSGATGLGCFTTYNCKPKLLDLILGLGAEDPSTCVGWTRMDDDSFKFPLEYPLTILAILIGKEGLCLPQHLLEQESLERLKIFDPSFSNHYRCRASEDFSRLLFRGI